METFLAGGEEVCVLQILDDHSRLDVGSHAARSENGADTWSALQQALKGYGLPVKVLSDNGLAISGKHRGTMVALERHRTSKGSSRSRPRCTTRRPAGRTSAPTRPRGSGWPPDPHRRTWPGCQDFSTITDLDVGRRQQLRSILNEYRHASDQHGRHFRLAQGWVRCRFDKDLPRIDLIGEDDMMMAPQFDAAQLARAAGHVVVNLAEVTFFGCAGLTFVARLNLHLGQTGHRIWIASPTPSPTAARVLALTGFVWGAEPPVTAFLGTP